MVSRNESLARKLSKFEAVFCPGFLPTEPGTVTALALLFERTHFLNHLEYVIRLAPHLRVILPSQDASTNAYFTFRTPDEGAPDKGPIFNIPQEEDPFSRLTKEERQAAAAYLFSAMKFHIDYGLLFPDVFTSSLNAGGDSIPLPNSKVFSALLELRDSGEIMAFIDGGRFNLGREEELDLLISQGKIPVLAGISLPESSQQAGAYSAAQIAGMLALHSIAMVLPAMKEGDAETILEAREKLRDHLPPFWSSMLKLSTELSARLDATIGTEKMQQREVDYVVAHVVDATVRPALIDLVDKLEKERKQWAYKILSPLSKGLSVLVGKPPVTSLELIGASLGLGANVALGITDQFRKVETMKKESGLVYLLELHQLFSKPPRKKRKKRKS